MASCRLKFCFAQGAVVAVVMAGLNPGYPLFLCQIPYLAKARPGRICDLRFLIPQPMFCERRRIGIGEYRS